MQNRLNAIQVQRCRDHDVITGILRRDYFDDPIPRLSDNVIQTFARQWIATRREMYLLRAEVDGSYAGFVFGHTLGPRFWRLFARKHPNHFPELVWTALKMRFGGKAEPGSALRLNGSNSADLESRITGLKIPTLPQAWAPADSGTGFIPLLFVNSDYRGHGVAALLLNQLSEAMFRDGAKCVEAHVDLHNSSSVRAFQKAGFEVYRMATDDFWARKINPVKQD
jgi:RimJ/RimL family protein N-acetyltransferase